MKTEPWSAYLTSVDRCHGLDRDYSLVVEAFAAVNPDKPFPKDKELLVGEGPAS